MMSRTESVASLLLVLLAASCSEAEGDAGATTTAAGSGGGLTTAVGPMAATTTGAGGSGGLGSGGSEGSAGGTTGQGGCLEPAPPEVCHAIEDPTDCDDTPGCGWYWNVQYLSLVGGKCDYSNRDYCLALDECIAPGLPLGHFMGDEVIQASGPCGLLLGWTPCSGDETDPPACACAENEMRCD